MAFKTFVLLMACASYASAGVLPVVRAESAEYDPHPQYSYGYDIQDAITGDSKNHQEIRDGDVVRGQYSLNDADGTRRIVDYTADPINGFNAVVRKEPLVGPVVAQAAPVLAPAPVAAAPTIIDARAAPVVAARAVAPAAPLFAPSAPGVVAARFSAPVAYSAAPGPLAYSAGAPLAYSAGAPLAYSAAAPLAYSAPGPLAYSAAPAPYARVASPLAYTNAYSAPLGYSAGPIAYSGVPAPLAYSSPIARLASPYNLGSPFSPVY